MPRTIIQFPVAVTPKLVMVRVYIEHASEPLRLYYKSENNIFYTTDVTYPRDGLYTFYLHHVTVDTEYKYHLKTYDVHGHFKTLPTHFANENVKFNMLSCFGYKFDEVTENGPRHGIFPDDRIDFNLLLGDSIYADYYFTTDDSKILTVRPSSNIWELDKVYRERVFEVHKIKEMFEKSLNFILADEHEIFGNWNSFYRSFQYDTTPILHGFSELQLVANSIYTLLTLTNPEITAPPLPFPVLSQDDEPILWSVESTDYSDTVNNAYYSFQDNLNPNLSYFKFSYGKHIDFFVLNIMADRTPLRVNRNTQILSIMSLEQFNWLLAGLSESRAEVKFIVTTEPFSDVLIMPRFPFFPTSEKMTFTELYNSLVNDPTFYTPLVSVLGSQPLAVPAYEALTPDQKFRVFGSSMATLNAANWMYYDQSNTIINIPQTNKQRNQIINFIRENHIHGVIFLTGNYHSSYVGYIDDLRHHDSFPIIEICSSPVGSLPVKTLTEYIDDHPSQKQFAFVTHKNNYMHISTHIDEHKIHIRCIKHGEDTHIKINLNKYKKLQEGHRHKKPIEVNDEEVL